MPLLQKELGVANVHALPRIEKVVLNVGAGHASRDAKLLDAVAATLRNITGQKPVITKARKSISNFKIREGMGVGAMVTLRGNRMYEFLDKLVNITLPRVRDFHGLPRTAFDSSGNYTLAFKEHNVFPEISSDAAEQLHGLQVTVAIKSPSPAASALLLQSLGFPLRSEAAEHEEKPKKKRSVRVKNKI